MNSSWSEESGKSTAAELVLVIWASMLDVVCRSRISSAFCKDPGSRYFGGHTDVVSAFLESPIEVIEGIVKYRVINMNLEWVDSDNGA